MSNTSLILESNLQMFFYEHLQRINSQLHKNLTNEMLLYTSLVLDEYAMSTKFFEIKEDKVSNKVLGMKYLEASTKSSIDQINEIKDVAETSLMICGYFFDSIKNKIVDLNYYERLGQLAYQSLDGLVPNFYDVPFFYKKLSMKIEDVIFLMNVTSREFNQSSDPNMPWLIKK